MPQANNPVSSLSQSVTAAYKKDKNRFLIIAAVFLVVVVAGVFTGKKLATGRTGTSAPTGNSAPGAKSNTNEAGVTDASSFPDTVQGTLKEGGIDGEGSFHLERDGGPSQNVYLSSTVIDLQSFVGKKVQVWGQTLSAKKAGWLMDVGKIKVI